MLKVMFVCCAGMSTSLLVQKVLAAAKEKGEELDLYAVGEAEARKNLTQADILLLGPQVRYLESKLRKELEGTTTKLGVCDMRAYGTMDGNKVLEQIHDLAAQ
jgi:PTS system cellobiose-specific IIB component